MTDMNRTKKEPRIPIMEHFGPTIQGEGLMAGTVTNFLRTGGCGLKCAWCDSMFAVDPKQVRAGRTMMSTADLLYMFHRMPWAPYITFTGGDPCLHKHLGDIIPAINAVGTRIAVETQGTEFPDWLMNCDVITFSPKPPTSGNIVDPIGIRDWIKQANVQCRFSNKRTMQICIKIVIFNLDDLAYALDVYKHMPEQFYDAFYFTAGTTVLPHDVKFEDLTDEEKAGFAEIKVESVLKNFSSIANSLLATVPSIQFNHKVHVGCQLHALLWPEKDKGV